LGEQIVQTEETLHGNQEESRQEKETLSGRMLVQKFPKASQEKHLLRGFSSGEGAMSAPKTIAIKLDTIQSLCSL
jgi:hypothetical protein